MSIKYRNVITMDRQTKDTDIKLQITSVSLITNKWTIHNGPDDKKRRLKNAFYKEKVK